MKYVASTHFRKAGVAGKYIYISLYIYKDQVPGRDAAALNSYGYTLHSCPCISDAPWKNQILSITVFLSSKQAVERQFGIVVKAKARKQKAVKANVGPP